MPIKLSEGSYRVELYPPAGDRDSVYYPNVDVVYINMETPGEAIITLEKGGELLAISNLPFLIQNQKVDPA